MDAETIRKTLEMARSATNHEELAIQLRQIAAVLDPAGAALANSKVDLQKQVDQWRKDYQIAAGRRDNWKRRAEGAETALARMTEQKGYYQTRVDQVWAKYEAKKAELAAATATITVVEDAELRAKLDREVEAHRANCVTLEQESSARRAIDKAWAAEKAERLKAEAALKQMVAARDLERRRRIEAEEKMHALATSFMSLHNVAKDIVGPKPKTVEQARNEVLAQLSGADRRALGLPDPEPKVGRYEMVKGLTEDDLHDLGIIQ